MITIDFPRLIVGKPDGIAQPNGVKVCVFSESHAYCQGSNCVAFHHVTAKAGVCAIGNRSTILKSDPFGKGKPPVNGARMCSFSHSDCVGDKCTQFYPFAGIHGECLRIAEYTGRMKQLVRFENPAAKRWCDREQARRFPKINTLAARALTRLLKGQRLVHRDFQEETGSYRLAVFVSYLRNICCWPIETEKVTALTEDATIDQTATYTRYYISPNRISTLETERVRRFIQSVNKFEDEQCK